MLESCGREMCEGPRYDPSTNEIGSTYMGDDKLYTEMHVIRCMFDFGKTCEVSL